MHDRTPPPQRATPHYYKRRYSFDGDHRARLLDYDAALSTPSDSPRTPARVLEGVAARRRRPLLLLGAAAIILLASAGLYRHPASWEAIRANADALRANVGIWVPQSFAKSGKDAAATASPLPADRGAIAYSSGASIEAIKAQETPEVPSESKEADHLGTQSQDSASGPEGTTPPNPKEIDKPASVQVAQGEFAQSSLRRPVGFPADIEDVSFMDTRPRLRIPSRADADEKYLSYLPHSGFHNQRIEFENALVLAQLLNRTLLTPLVRLGKSQGWLPSPHLQETLEQDDKQQRTACIGQLNHLERGIHTDGCESYTDYTMVSWDTLVDLQPLEKAIRLLDRSDMSRAWFTSAEGLGLEQADIETFQDASRYSIRFYDTKTDREANGKYKRRLDVEELRDGPLADKRLLEFGSLFGSARIKVSTPEHRRLGRLADNQMVFRNTLLTSIATDLVDRLGGRDAYVGLHLRVGDGFFARLATKNMQRTFKTMCSEIFKLDRGTCTALYTAGMAKGRKLNHARRTEHPPASNYAWLDNFDPVMFASVEAKENLQRRALHAPLQCHGQLHMDPRLKALNMPAYIATDARNPRSDPNLAVFFHALPCAFVLGDFRGMPGLQALEQVRSLQEGVRMAPFLIPFLEAMMAARSRIATIGTPGSTFSGFAATTLHRIYSQESDQAVSAL